MKLADDVYKIKGDCNVYLVMKPEPMVIDTGCPAEREKIRAGIEEITPLDSIKTVVLTHLHFDHCGNVNLFPNAKFYAAKPEIDDMNTRPEVFFFGRIPDELREVLFHKLQPVPNTINGLSIIKVPGHTCGSISFLDDKRKLLFSGDTIFRAAIGRTDFPNSVPEKMEESVSKLVTLLREKKLLLCPGHDY